MNLIINKGMFELKWNREAALLISLFFFSLLIRLAYHYSVVMVEPVIRADAAKYILTALNLVDSGVYSYGQQPPLQSSSLLVPGYPLLLSLIYAITHDVTTTIKLTFNLQIILGSLMPVFVTLIAKRILPLYWAIFSGLLISVYPHQVVTSSYLLTETIFGVLVITSIYYLIRSYEQDSLKNILICGVLISLATLTRPIMILFMPFLFVALLRYKSVAKKGLLITSFMVFLCWLPWSLWGHFGADNKESNMKQVVAYGTYPNFIYDKVYGSPNREDPEFNHSISSWSALSEYFFQRAEQEPVKYLYWYMLGKPYSLWSFNIVQGQGGAFIYPVESSLYDHSGFYSWTYTFVKLVHPAIAILALLSAFIIMLKVAFQAPSKSSLPLVIVSGVVTYVTLFHIPLASLPRFSIPFQGFMVMLALVAIHYLFERLKESRS